MPLKSSVVAITLSEAGQRGRDAQLDPGLGVAREQVAELDALDRLRRRRGDRPGGRPRRRRTARVACDRRRA